MHHIIEDIETLTWKTAPKIIMPSEIQNCESGFLQSEKNIFDLFKNDDDMVTYLTSHALNPFYMENRYGEKQLFMYSPKCHAHFPVGAVTTIVTDGKAYYTVGNIIISYQ